MSFVPALLIRTSRPEGCEVRICSLSEVMLDGEEMSRAG